MTCAIINISCFPEQEQNIFMEKKEEFYPAYVTLTTMHHPHSTLKKKKAKNTPSVIR